MPCAKKFRHPPPLWRDAKRDFYDQFLLAAKLPTSHPVGIPQFIEGLVNLFKNLKVVYRGTTEILYFTYTIRQQSYEICRVGRGRMPEFTN